MQLKILLNSVVVQTTAIKSNRHNNVVSYVLDKYKNINVSNTKNCNTKNNKNYYNNI